MVLSVVFFRLITSQVLATIETTVEDVETWKTCLPKLGLTRRGKDISTVTERQQNMEILSACV